MAAISDKTKLAKHRNSEAGRFPKTEVNIPAKSTIPGTPKNPAIDIFAKEEQYKIINAELEAKTADIVRQAEQLMREQNEVLSKPVSTHIVFDNEDSRITNLRQPVMQNPGLKETTPKKLTSRLVSQNRHSRSKNKEQPASYKTITPTLSLNDDEAVEIFSLAKAIHSLEDKLDNGYATVVADETSNIQENTVADAQIRVLKAKLHVMQEEMDHLSHQCSKKDDENSKLCTKIKEVEDDRARLQKHTSNQQAQIEKQRALAEESSKKCDGLQLQVASLQKEIETISRAQKQAATQQSSVELRLNRALDEVERLKSQLNKTKQMSKDKMNEDHQNKESLLAENKNLKKQKAELIMGFKKQLKLIDILKRQKMHFEAAKILSFTEEEFMTALDWGKS